jgi:hypothetical protein
MVTANVSDFDTVIENLYFYDSAGAFLFGDSSRTLGPLQHESFLFSSRCQSRNKTPAISPVLTLSRMMTLAGMRYVL